MCIILICFVVEVGEWFGFFFGMLIDKIDLYLCLLYDVLNEMMDFEIVLCLMVIGMIEVVLLVYMCGCMFNDLFVVFDEV